MWRGLSTILLLTTACDDPGNRGNAHRPGQMAKAPRQDTPAQNLLPGVEPFNEEVVDSPAKTQISFAVIIPPETTRAQGDALLRKLYADTTARTGFRYHKHPNSVYAFLYYDRKTQKHTPGAWIAAIQKTISSEPGYTNKIVDGTVVEQVKAALGIDKEPSSPTATTIALDRKTGAVELTLHLTGFLDDDYSAKLEKHNAWSTVFIVLNLAYPTAQALDALHLTMIHKGNTVVDLTMDRDLWSKMEHARTLDEWHLTRAKLHKLLDAKRISLSVYDAKVQRMYLEGYRKMLKGIPRGQMKVYAKLRL